MTRIDFPQGVPAGCLEWLDQHVGLSHPGHSAFLEPCTWYYERRFKQYPDSACGEGSYIPSITVKDPDKAMWFALRWSGK